MRSAGIVDVDQLPSKALLEGDSEKQAAARVGLRTSTVHSYVRDLYRRYGVRSRGEPMARFVRRPR